MAKQKNISWEFAEYKKIKRSRLWYLMLGILLAILLGIAIVQKNFLFAVILILAAFIYIWQSLQEPLKIRVTIDETGIQVGKKKIPYHVLKNFWLVYQPPESKFLYLSFENSLKTNLALPLEDVNPLTVREILIKFLEEDVEKENEELYETLDRLFRF